MSTITETRETAPARRARPWVRTIVTGGGALLVWLALLAGVTVIAEPHADVMVLGPPRHTLSLLRGTDIRLTDLQETHAVLHGTGRGFVRQLYAHGALVVLPARAPGCMALRR